MNHNLWLITNDSHRLTRSEAESFAPTFSLNSVSVNFSPYSSLNCVFDIRLVLVQKLAWYRVFLNGWFNYKDWWRTPNQSRKIMNHNLWFISIFLEPCIFLIFIPYQRSFFSVDLPDMFHEMRQLRLQKSRIHCEKMIK